MPRIFGDKQSIDSTAVMDFFEQRAIKSELLGPLRAVIYQDKHPDLAEQRDKTEKALLFPKLWIGDGESVLDVGCGTGRWAEAIVPFGGRYHGTDFSPGLIAIAKQRFGQHDNARFSVCPAQGLMLSRLGESEAFDRIVSFGLFIYLNDDDALESMTAMLSCAATTCRVVLREPIAIKDRLTIKEHFSTDMDQTYNAIYRTEFELMSMIENTFLASGFKLMESGDVYTEQALNNRAETKQRFYILAR